MSDPVAPSQKFNDSSTLCFVVILCVVCALILSVLASALKDPQQQAIEFDRSKQMLLAARLFSVEGGIEGNKTARATPTKRFHRFKNYLGQKMREGP